MHHFKLNGIDNKMPGTWSELTPAQVLQLVSFLHADRTPELRLKVLRVLYPVKTKLLKQMSTEDVFDLTELACSILDKPVEQSPIRSFYHNDICFHLPRPDFDDVRAVEYAMADTYFRLFAQSGKPEHLDSLVATLCRPLRKNLDESDPEWDGDVREKYNSRLAERRAKELSSLQLEMKVVVLQYFLYVKRSIHTTYAAVFVEPDEAGGSPAGGGPNFGMLAVIYSLAEQGIFGDFEKTAFTSINTVMTYLLKKHYDK